MRPDRTIGNCLSVYECPSVLNQLGNGGGVSLKVAEYLRSLQCTGDSGQFPFVCCELVTTADEPRIIIDTTNEPPRKPSTNSAGGDILPGRGHCGIDSFGQKIYGGKATGLDEFPWVVLLEYRTRM